ncbi:MAG: fimbrillin family protein, partial [Odoribacter sp.]|nr:fimbrillin family protein [Odoribacter sp.]
EKQAEPLTFPNGSPYYPLGDNDIRFFAYTGQLNGSGNIPLRSGNSLNNDYLLSNQGYRNGTAVITTEGEGTPGSSQNPAEILQFRHVMTQINLIVKINETEQQDTVDRVPENVTLGISNIRLTGEYSINALTQDIALNPQGGYILQKGINYVIPTGRDLTQETIASLIADDYTATGDDLAALSIDYISGETNAYLVPGYAYNLTLNFSRLRIVGIEIERIDWIPHEVTNEDISYTPYVLNLDLGSYDAATNGEITKVVMWTDTAGTNPRVYTGELKEDTNEISFVTLPASGAVDSVALYASLGLLLAVSPDNYTFNTLTEQGTLELNLSKGGMKLLKSGVPAGRDNPYMISTPVQIFNIASDESAAYILMNDVDVDRLNYSESNTLSGLNTFSGYFDGNGYRINNLMLTGSGLIGTNNGTIENLHLSAGRINAIGENVAGSICAVNNGIIVACISEARIINASDVVGGICGENTANARVIACVNTGNIENGITLGGIAGTNQNISDSAFVSCVNTGSLAKGVTNIGGIIGQSAASTNTVIINSFWLVGTAANVFGGSEYATGGGILNVGATETAALSPEKLRDDLTGTITADAQETLDYLNAALSSTAWNGFYEFILNQNITGLVWPIPVNINSNY